MDRTRSTLLIRVRNPADARAWGEFVALYEPLLTAYVRHKGLSAEDARDVVQEVFARLVKILPEFELDRQRGRFRSWLWQICQSALGDWARQRRRQARAEDAWLDRLSEPRTSGESERMTSGSGCIGAGSCPSPWRRSGPGRGRRAGPASSGTCSSAAPAPRSPASWVCRSPRSTSTARGSSTACGSSVSSTWKDWPMASNPCPEDPELLAMVMGSTVPEPVRRHVDACGACRLRIDRLRAELSAVRHVADELPAGTVPAALVAAIAETASHPTATESSEDDFEVPEPTEPRPRPESIGRYRIVGELDSGGQASVYRAVHPTLPRDLAIKIAHEPSEIDRSLLRGDAEILCELDHPNLVRVHDLDIHDGRPFVAMEFVRGRNLQQVAEQSPPSPYQAAAWVAEIARALAYVHRSRGRAPGHQAQEHHAGRVGPPAADRFRHGPVAARLVGQPGGSVRGDAGVHGPGAGARRGQAGRSSRATSSAWAACSTSC